MGEGGGWEGDHFPAHIASPARVAFTDFDGAKSVRLILSRARMAGEAVELAEYLITIQDDQLFGLFGVIDKGVLEINEAELSAADGGGDG